MPKIFFQEMLLLTPIIGVAIFVRGSRSVKINPVKTNVRKFIGMAPTFVATSAAPILSVLVLVPFKRDWPLGGRRSKTLKIL